MFTWRHPSEVLSDSFLHEGEADEAEGPDDAVQADVDARGSERGRVAEAGQAAQVITVLAEKLRHRP